PLADHTLRGLLLKTDTRQTIAFAADAVFAGIIVNLVAIPSVEAHRETGAGGFEIVVGLRPGSGAKFFVLMPLRNHVLVFHTAAAEIVARGLLARAVRVRRRIVGEHERVFALLVLEVIVDALLLHEAGNKIEIGLAILYAILARAERPVQAQLEVL